MGPIRAGLGRGRAPGTAALALLLLAAPAFLGRPQAAGPPARLAAAYAEEPAAAPAAEAPKARSAPLKEILESPAETLQVFLPDGDPRILLFKFPSLTEQARMLNRVAAFTEKKGAPKDRVLSGAELSALIKREGTDPEDFYLGHDYSAEELARFFSAAERDRQTLSRDEIVLRSILIAEKAIGRAGSRYVALMPVKAAISYAERSRPDATDRSDPDYAALRCTIAEHELSHGVYFTDPRYSGSVIAFWHKVMRADERTTFTTFLGRLDYDTTNKELMVNEMQAFLMHTPDSHEFSATLLGVPEAELKSLRMRFAAATPSIALLNQMSAYCPRE